MGYPFQFLFCFGQIRIVLFPQAHPEACQVTKASQPSLKSLPLEIQSSTGHSLFCNPTGKERKNIFSPYLEF